eukprot:3711277-Rhodomonas_salina.1
MAPSGVSGTTLRTCNVFPSQWRNVPVGSLGSSSLKYLRCGSFGILVSSGCTSGPGFKLAAGAAGRWTVT